MQPGEVRPGETAATRQLKAGRDADKAAVAWQQFGRSSPGACRLLVGHFRSEAASRRTGEVIGADAVVASRGRSGCPPGNPRWQHEYRHSPGWHSNEPSPMARPRTNRPAPESDPISQLHQRSSPAQRERPSASFLPPRGCHAHAGVSTAANVLLQSPVIAALAALPSRQAKARAGRSSADPVRQAPPGS